MARVLLWGHGQLGTFLPWVLKLGILSELDVTWCPNPESVPTVALLQDLRASLLFH